MIWGVCSGPAFFSVSSLDLSDSLSSLAYRETLPSSLRFCWSITDKFSLLMPLESFLSVNDLGCCNWQAFFCNTILRRSFIPLIDWAKFRTELLLALGVLFCCCCFFFIYVKQTRRRHICLFFLSGKTNYRMFNIKMQITYSELTCI